MVPEMAVLPRFAHRSRDGLRIGQFDGSVALCRRLRVHVQPMATARGAGPGSSAHGET